MPNAAPISPKLWARFSGGVTSAIYAIDGEYTAPATPAIARPMKSNAKVGAKPISM
jgi:hypothetical protein